MLQVADLEVFYGNIRALRGVSFDVQEGEIATVIGSNGAGKSTMLKTITGLLKPQRGKMTYLESDLLGLVPYEIVKLGVSLCPEGRRIFSSLTVYENLIMGASQRRKKKEGQEDMDWVLTLFPVLKERLYQRGGTLSGGEQQMLAMGRALMSKPHLLLLDEPSLGLAPILVKKIFKIILSLRDTGTTILLVEQNARQALDISNRGYVLEVGRIILEGACADLKTREEVKAAYLGG